MPNDKGQLAGLPKTAIVELPTLVDRAGLQHTAVGELPPQLVAYMNPHVTQHELFIRAAMEGFLTAEGPADPDVFAFGAQDVEARVAGGLVDAVDPVRHRVVEDDPVVGELILHISSDRSRLTCCQCNIVRACTDDPRLA